MLLDDEIVDRNIPIVVMIVVVIVVVYGVCHYIAVRQEEVVAIMTVFPYSSARIIVTLPKSKLCEIGFFFCVTSDYCTATLSLL